MSMNVDFTEEEIVLYRIGKNWHYMGPLNQPASDRVIASLQQSKVPAFICMVSEFLTKGLPEDSHAGEYFECPPPWWN